MAHKTAKYDLALIFSQIEQTAGAVENVAKDMLAAIRAHDAKTLDQFNDMVFDAYERNGWSRHAGRPVDGMKERPAPDAVKLYVSTVRAAYRLGLDVLQYETMGAMRSDIRKKRTESLSVVEKPPELKGVQISSAASFTGALWHDVVVLWEHLPADDQQELERQVRRLLAKFTKSAPSTLLAAAA